MGAAEWATRATLWAGGLVFCLLAFPLWSRGGPWRVALVVTLCGWVANAYAGYLQASFSSSSDFRRLSRVLLLDAAVGVALLVLVPAFGFVGFCLRSAIQPIVQAVALHLGRPFRGGPRSIAPASRRSFG